MKFHTCKKIKFKTPGLIKNRTQIRWFNASPTAYKIRGIAYTQFAVEHSEIKNFQKYLKYKDIINLDIGSNTVYYSLYVKELRILNNLAKKVKYIFEESIDDVFLNLGRNRSTPLSADITSELRVLEDLYEPKNINNNLEYLKKEIMRREQDNRYKEIRFFLYSLILFTIDTLKDMFKKYDTIEFICNECSYLFYFSFSECEKDNISLRVPEEMPEGIVKFVNKAEDIKNEVKEEKLSMFLDKLTDKFEKYVKTKTKNEEYAFPDKKRLLIKEIILYSIGVFSLHYIIQSINFNDFAKDNFVYREVSIGIEYKEERNFLSIDTDNTKLHLKKYDKSFLTYIDSLARKRNLDTVVFLEKNEFHTSSVVVSDSCLFTFLNISEKFLFFVIKPQEYDDGTIYLHLKCPASFKHVMRILDLFTGHQYNKDLIYEMAFRILYGIKTTEAVSF